MKKSRIPLPKRTRWKYEDVVLRVREYLDREDTPSDMRKRFEEATGLDHSAFSHRMSAYRGQLFRVEHFGAMAEEARWPTGFPWLPWEDAARFDALKSLIARSAP